MKHKDLGSTSVGQSKRYFVVIRAPRNDLHSHLDLALVVKIELLDQLFHLGAIWPGESVPEVEFNRAVCFHLPLGVASPSHHDRH